MALETCNKLTLNAYMSKEMKNPINLEIDMENDNGKD